MLTDAGAVAAAVETTVQVAADNAPVAEAGGPYSSNIGDALTLDASASYDVDGEALEYHWDLDGDGPFDDADGVAAEIEWVTLQQIVCGGELRRRRRPSDRPAGHRPARRQRRRHRDDHVHP